ncbi:hypothetical protein K4A83_20170 [Spirulina subsalsa FACHB-351]|uniref:Uncharacterized protein n=1 Tax=Spirulina subsalsa FACHB-351 TaxID=234711 RepID=A0ABT3LAN8_9CYAN|nr:hypothetical protein [Spirulina subsalsa]MCW6038571.1 hypothetical protein [Spirulina subsalsa FACHB-351]
MKTQSYEEIRVNYPEGRELIESSYLSSSGLDLGKLDQNKDCLMPQDQNPYDSPQVSSLSFDQVVNNIKRIERLYVIYSEILQYRWISTAEVALVRELATITSLPAEHRLMIYRILHMVDKNRVEVVETSSWSCSHQAITFLQCLV